MIIIFFYYFMYKNKLENIFMKKYMLLVHFKILQMCKKNKSSLNFHTQNFIHRYLYKERRLQSHLYKLSFTLIGHSWTYRQIDGASLHSWWNLGNYRIQSANLKEWIFVGNHHLGWFTHQCDVLWGVSLRTALTCNSQLISWWL